MVENVVLGFLSMFFKFFLFRRFLFVLSLWFVCLLGGTQGWGNGVSVWGTDCMCLSVGRLWFEMVDAYEMYGRVRWMQGFVGSFCFAPTVACVSQTSFVYCR